MAKLTAAKRKKMPKSEFALSGKRFPMNDATHQRLAISGATRAERAGNISAGTAAKIKAEARKKLGIKGSGVKRPAKAGPKRPPRKVMYRATLAPKY